mmetsp:Transcript_74992/g.173923  ORF Transcript_74992/g.173923 Transcript_74992/m.173923 type:complete len:255 (+) Transcript_74992:3-767(+)
MRWQKWCGRTNPTTQNCTSLSESSAAAHFWPGNDPLGAAALELAAAPPLASARGAEPLRAFGSLPSLWPPPALRVLLALSLASLPSLTGFLLGAATAESAEAGGGCGRPIVLGSMPPALAGCRLPGRSTMMPSNKESRLGTRTGGSKRESRLGAFATGTGAFAGVSARLWTWALPKSASESDSAHGSGGTCGVLLGLGLAWRPLGATFLADFTLSSVAPPPAALPLLGEALSGLVADGVGFSLSFGTRCTECLC